MRKKLMPVEVTEPSATLSVDKKEEDIILPIDEAAMLKKEAMKPRTKLSTLMVAAAMMGGSHTIPEPRDKKMKQKPFMQLDVADVFSDTSGLSHHSDSRFSEKARDRVRKAQERRNQRRKRNASQRTDKEATEHSG